MHVTLTRASTGDASPEYATMVGAELTRWLADIEGFEGFLMLSRPGESIGLSFWASAEVAEEHRASRRRFVERMTGVAGVQIEEMVDYALTFADLRGLQLAEPPADA